MGIHNVKIPEPLKLYKSGIGIGLMYLALGRAVIPEKNNAGTSDELGSARFELSEQGETYLEQLSESHSKREIFKAALLWVSQQPAHIQQSNI